MDVMNIINIIIITMIYGFAIYYIYISLKTLRDGLNTRDEDLKKSAKILAQKFNSYSDLSECQKQSMLVILETKVKLYKYALGLFVGASSILLGWAGTLMTTYFSAPDWYAWLLPIGFVSGLVANIFKRTWNDIVFLALLKRKVNE